MAQYQENIKHTIKDLISSRHLAEASELARQYQDIVIRDIELYSMQAIIAILENRFADAESILQQGLEIDKNNFDIIYNLAYVYEAQEKKQQAYSLYLQLSKCDNKSEYHNLVLEAMERLQEFAVAAPIEIISKQKIIFFAKQGLDNFLDNIIKGLSEQYETKKMIVTNLSQIDKAMQEADICWFEWCDELIIYASKLELAKNKKIICRLHRYEAFSEYVNNVKWENVDKVIFVSKHICDVVRKKVQLPIEKCEIIHNGINFEEFKFINRKKGYNLAWIGYLNLRKNPMLILQYLKELVKIDKKYQLHIAGSFQDETLSYYMHDMVRKMNLQNHVHFAGFIPNAQMSDWLKDKHYIVTGSIAEGHPVGVMEAMASGLKPVIHYFPGVESFYPKEYIYYDLDNFRKIVIENKYNSLEYKDYIKQHYSMDKQIHAIKSILEEKISSSHSHGSEEPLVTIGVINYNQDKYIEECLQSIIGQEYANIEILIIDDCSTDKSLEIIERYRATYNNIQLLRHGKNSGSDSKSIQDVQLQANGKYFTFINAKDYYPNSKVITNYVAIALENQNIDFIYGDHRIINYNGEQIGFLKNHFLQKEKIIEQIYTKFGLNAMPMIGLYKKSFFEQNKLTWYYDKVLKSNYDVINCLINLKHNWQYKNIEEEVLCSRQIEKNVTVSLGNEVQYFILIAEYILKNFSETDYITEINWDQIHDQTIKQSTKMYYIGRYFYRVFIEYITEYSVQATSTKIAKTLVDVLRPIEKKTEVYFRNSLRTNGMFTHDIMKMKDEMRNFKKRIETVFLKNVVENMPKVSIVIPTYNRKNMLKAALESVRTQDYLNLEIIVTDNASTDGTEELMSMYVSDSRIKYTRNEKNMGPAFNFSNGYSKLATGQYVLLLNDDDCLIDDRYISKAINLIRQDPNIVLVHANCKVLNVDTNEIQYTDFQSTGIFNGLGYFLNYERNQTCPHIMGMVTALMRRDILLQKGVLEIKSKNTLAGDLITYLFFMLWGKGNIAVIRDYAGEYKIHSGNMSNGLRSFELTGEKKDGTIEGLERLASIAMEQGVPEEIIRDWMDYRIWRFVRWCCCEFFSTGQIEKGLEVLNSIQEKYPNPFQKLKEEFIR